MARLFRLLPVAMVAAAMVASGVDAASSGGVATDAAVDATALSMLSAHTPTSVNGTTPVWRLADANGCKPMDACESLQSHLASRFGATGRASCFGSHYGVGNSVLHMVKNTLNTIIAANCCATHVEFPSLTAMTKMLMNIDTCPMSNSVPQRYVSPFNFQTTFVYTGLSTSMLTTAHVFDMESCTRVAPVVGAELRASAKDIIFDLGECCLPYFEFINQNEEHTCCHEACWHMVDVLGIFFTMEECCADGANQSGTYVVCP